MISFCRNFACTFFLLFFAATVLQLNGFAQTIVSNTSEEKVPPYTLPDPLIGKDGKR